uniref:conjugal transfer transcriptional regulator TraJ n=2 Tax=Aeromonas caviae TaxID=648 RepID=UPI0035A25696
MMEETKRKHHLRVPVFKAEQEAIEENAARAGMSVARYLREVGMGYKIQGVVDFEQVKELAKINGDLGRLGGLLKLWLTDDVRTARFGADTITAVLERVMQTQAEMSAVMTKVVIPRSGKL